MYKLFLIYFFISFSLFSQNTTTSQYILKFKDLAMEEMYKYNIPASITLSQSVIESNFGKSKLAKYGNNFFGIKCHGWRGFKNEKNKMQSNKQMFNKNQNKKFFTNRFEVYFDDDKENECFRKYKKIKHSFRDHSFFLSKRGRYSFLFELDILDYESWAKGLKTAGYATDKNYSTKLIDIIENYNLSLYDDEVVKKQKYDQELFPKKLTFLYEGVFGLPSFIGLGVLYGCDKYGQLGFNLQVTPFFIFNSYSYSLFLETRINKILGLGFKRGFSGINVIGSSGFDSGYENYFFNAPYINFKVGKIKHDYNKYSYLLFRLGFYNLEIDNQQDINVPFIEFVYRLGFKKTNRHLLF